MNYQIFYNIVLATSLILVIANSYSLIYFTTKFFHVTHAAVITLGPYLVFFFANKLSIPFWFSLTLSIALTLGIGLLCETLVYRQMRKKNVPALAYLIASIGLYVVLQNFISLYFGDDTKIINIAEITVGNLILGAYITDIQIATIFISSAFFLGVYFLYYKTILGKQIRAVSENKDLANIYGISSDKIILICVTLSSALGAMAGILYALDTNLTPTMGFNLLLYGIVAMIIGGVGSFRGLLYGSLLLATAQNLVAYYLDTKWMDAATYVILIGFLLWKSLGFSGKRLKKVEI